jgi:hypothetical protein
LTAQEGREGTLAEEGVKRHRARLRGRSRGIRLRRYYGSRGDGWGRVWPHFYSKICYLFLNEDQLLLRHALDAEQILQIRQALQSLLDPLIQRVALGLQP